MAKQSRSITSCISWLAPGIWASALEKALEPLEEGVVLLPAGAEEVELEWEGDREIKGFITGFVFTIEVID